VAALAGESGVLAPDHYSDSAVAEFQQVRRGGVAAGEVVGRDRRDPGVEQAVAVERQERQPDALASVDLRPAEIAGDEDGALAAAPQERVGPFVHAFVVISRQLPQQPHDHLDALVAGSFQDRLENMEASPGCVGGRGCPAGAVGRFERRG
jgi:hypothetical protein